MSRPNQPFSTIKTEGLLLPPELIARVADLDTKLPRNVSMHLRQEAGEISVARQARCRRGRVV